jgi:hypothetical protein
MHTENGFNKHVLHEYEIENYIIEKEPTRCHLVLYYTYDRLNVFRTALCPSPRAQNYISDYHMDCQILRLLMVGG